MTLGNTTVEIYPRTPDKHAFDEAETLCIVARGNSGSPFLWPNHRQRAGDIAQVSTYPCPSSSTAVDSFCGLFGRACAASSSAEVHVRRQQTV